MAHRGAAAEAPENTLDAFALAVELGADEFELDVRRSADDVLVVIHDPTLERTTTATGPVAGLTAESLARLAIPALETVFDRWRDVPMTVDVKEPELTARVVALIEAFGRVERTVLYVEEGVRRDDFRGYAGRRATSTGQALRLALLRWLPGVPGRGFPELVHTPRWRYGIPVVTPGFVADVHAHGREVQVWTVDDPSLMLRLAEWGVDAIVTNDVRAARTWLGPGTTDSEREMRGR